MARAPSWRFRLATEIHFGRGRFRDLGELAARFGRKALLVGYADPTGLTETYRRAAERLRKAGLSVAEFLQVAPEPNAESASAGAALARSAGAELVVAVGGGSVIDAGKGIALLARLGGHPWDYTLENPDARPAADKLPLVAVPTTAGTGAEVSNVAVFGHRRAGPQGEAVFKGSISGPALAPEIALVDPNLAVGSPPELTAACGADALGHAIEACLSRRANPVSTLFGGRAAGLVVASLARAVEAPDDPQPREPLALAATLAGAAFSEAGVGAAHALAQALGALLDVPHGVAVAVALPIALRFNREACVLQYAELARACGLAATSPQESADRFLARTGELLCSIGLPQRLPVRGGAAEELLEALAQTALQTAPVPITLNPRKLDQPALRAMFREALILETK